VAGDTIDQVPGDVRVNGFLVDMKAFDDFLVAALSRSLSVIGRTCRPQDRMLSTPCRGSR